MPNERRFMITLMIDCLRNLRHYYYYYQAYFSLLRRQLTSLRRPYQNA
jgi:hypothetical protein